MPLPRAFPAARALLRRPIPSSAPTISIRRLTQNSHYNPKTSDMPWLIGALAVTLPACAFLLSGDKPKPHKPTPVYDSHEKSTDPNLLKPETVAGKKPFRAEKTSNPEEGDSTNKNNQYIGESTSNVRDEAREATGEIREKAGELYREAKNKGEITEQSVTDPAAAAKEKAKETEDEVKEEVEETKDQVAEKLAESKEKVDMANNTQEQEVEAKGGDEKTRSVKLQELNKAQSGKPPSQTDPPAAGAKETGSFNKQSGKQEGLSNVDTWHPQLYTERGQAIAKKPEGAHQTAKLKGTIDPNKPAS